MDNNPMIDNQDKKDDFQDVIFESEAHKGLLEGATILYNAVKSTMGPSGHNVIIDRRIGQPLITKDGVTVAKSINLQKKLPRIGAELLKEIASKTNDLAGDGTTTATVLGFAMLAQGIKMIATGRSAIGIKKGMEFAVKEIITYLRKNSIKVRDKTDIINVGTISANGDKQIGELLAAAIEKVGNDGIITTEPNKSVQTTLDVVEGLQIESGYISPYFITNQEKMLAELVNPYVLITNRKISSLKEIIHLLEQISQQERSLLIIGDDIEGEALHTLILNKTRKTLNVCAVKAPSYGEYRTDILSDIAVLTNGQVIDASSGISLNKVSVSQLGTCKNVFITRSTTTLVGHNNNQIKQNINDRIEALRIMLTDDALDDLHRDKYRKRLAKLAGGIAVIKVGGSTEVEIFEKKDRVEDALNATRAAVEEGIVPGGGCALFYAANHLEKVLQSHLAEESKRLDEDEMAGITVILNACRYPLKVIVENTGKSPEVVITKLKEKIEKQEDWQKFGYNAYSEEYENLIDTGVIDPVKVSRLALEHACSVIGLLLTANCVIINKEEE